jgi:aspartate kinase
MIHRPALTDTDFCADPSARVGSANELRSDPTTEVLRVHKFGGTSVDGAERLKALAGIIQRQNDPAVVVVSAMAGVSNELSGLVGESADGLSAPDPSEIVVGLRRRHQDALLGLAEEGPERAASAARIDEILDRVAALLPPASGTRPLRLRDQLMAAGEDLTVELTVAALRAEGVSAVAMDARSVVWTDTGFGSAIPDVDAIGRLAPERMRPLLDAGTVPVVQGFIGSEAGGSTTTLGRGGSDFTAALLGAALEASEVVIWTDVDGMYSGDPNLVRSAEALPEVGFGEAVELAYFGARVIHPAAVKHAIARGVLLRIKNTFKPDGAGTLIHFDRRDTAAFAAVAHKTDVALIEVRAFPTAMAYGFLARVFAVLARHRVSVDLVATSHSSTAFTVDRGQELTEVRRALSVFSEVEVTEDVSTVTVVGRGLLREPGLDALVFWAIEKTPVYLISQASDVSISFVVDEVDAPELVRKLHLSLIELRRGLEAT